MEFHENCCEFNLKLNEYFDKTVNINQDIKNEADKIVSSGYFVSGTGSKVPISPKIKILYDIKIKINTSIKSFFLTNLLMRCPMLLF